MRAPRVWFALVACGVALVGGWFALSPMRADGAVAGDVSGRTWLAVDAPGARMPWLRFTGDGDRLDVEGNDGCNRLGGFLLLDGDRVDVAAMTSTLVSCGDVPEVGGPSTGATLSVAEGALTVTGPDGRTTRFVALDSLRPLTADELVGTYTVGVTALSIGAGTVGDGECERTWALDGATVTLDGPACAPTSLVGTLLAAPVWDAVAGDAERVVVSAGGIYVRLDRTAR